MRPRRHGHHVDRPFNPVSVIALSLWTMSRWTMIAHHTCRGNRQDDGTGRFTSKGFTVGSTVARVRDWFDWMLPERGTSSTTTSTTTASASAAARPRRAQHGQSGSSVPRPLKYLVVAGLAAIWKWYYYAPNTYKQLKIQEMRKAGVDVSERTRTPRSRSCTCRRRRARSSASARGASCARSWARTSSCGSSSCLRRSC